MNRTTRSYLINFIELLTTDVLTDSNKVSWNPIQESTKNIPSRDKPVVVINKIYRTADGRVMIKLVTDLADHVKAMSLTVCSDTFEFFKDTDDLAFVVLKLTKVLDAKLELVDVSSETQSYITNITNLITDNDINNQETKE